ncbi:MAG: hypothetical protein Q7S33_04440 [Nanoarchaeota archaeon]|nr:hypothetical protein [Nanoarchaeota archaeon]
MGLKNLISKVALISCLSFAGLNNGCYTVMAHKDIIKTENARIEQKIEINNYNAEYSGGGGYVYNSLGQDFYNPFWSLHNPFWNNYNYGDRYYGPDFGFGYSYYDLGFRPWHNDFWLDYYSPYRSHSFRHYPHIPFSRDSSRDWEDEREDRNGRSDGQEPKINYRTNERQIRMDRLGTTIRRTSQTPQLDRQNVNKPDQQNPINRSQRNYQNQQRIDRTDSQQPQRTERRNYQSTQPQQTQPKQSEQYQQPKSNQSNTERPLTQQPRVSPQPPVRRNSESITITSRRESQPVSQPRPAPQPQIKSDKPVSQPQSSPRQQRAPTQQNSSEKEKPVRRGIK